MTLGRPEKTAQFVMRLSGHEKAMLVALAKQDARSAADLVRALIRKEYGARFNGPYVLQMGNGRRPPRTQSVPGEFLDLDEAMRKAEALAKKLAGDPETPWTVVYVLGAEADKIKSYATSQHQKSA